MTTAMFGTHPHPSTDKVPHVGTGEPEPSAGSASHELTPDGPPPSPTASGEAKAKRARGFGAMDRKLVSEIARKGGKAAHSAGTAHEFTSEEARAAGRKGGRATHAKRKKEAGETQGPGPEGEGGGE
jgi:general stress protein YciG